MPRLLFGQALGLVDQGEFFRLLLGRGSQFLLLDGDLALVEFAAALDAEPLAHGHRAGAGQQTGQPGDQHRVAAEVHAGLGAGHAHDQAHVGAEAVVGAQDGCAKGISTHRAVATFEPGDCAALHPRLARTADGVQQPRVGVLVGLHVLAAGVGLGVVLGAVGRLVAGNGRQDEVGAEAAAHPGEGVGAKADAHGRDGAAGLADLLFPEGGVLVLAVSQAAVDLGQRGLGLDPGEGPIEGGAIAFGLEVGLVAGQVFGVGHIRSSVLCRKLAEA